MGDGIMPEWDAIRNEALRNRYAPTRSQLSLTLEGRATPFNLDAIRVQRDGWFARLLRFVASRWNDA